MVTTLDSVAGKAMAATMLINLQQISGHDPSPIQAFSRAISRYPADQISTMEEFTEEVVTASRSSPEHPSADQVLREALVLARHRSEQLLSSCPSSIEAELYAMAHLRQDPCSKRLLMEELVASSATSALTMRSDPSIDSQVDQIYEEALMEAIERLEENLFSRDSGEEVLLTAIDRLGDQHFPTKEALRGYLTAAMIKLPRGSLMHRALREAVVDAIAYMKQDNSGESPLMRLMGYLYHLPLNSPESENYLQEIINHSKGPPAEYSSMVRASAHILTFYSRPPPLPQVTDAERAYMEKDAFFLIPPIITQASMSGCGTEFAEFLPYSGKPVKQLIEATSDLIQVSTKLLSESGHSLLEAAMDLGSVSKKLLPYEGRRHVKKVMQLVPGASFAWSLAAGVYKKPADKEEELAVESELREALAAAAEQLEATLMSPLEALLISAVNINQQHQVKEALVKRIILAGKDPPEETAVEQAFKESIAAVITQMQKRSYADPVDALLNEIERLPSGDSFKQALIERLIQASKPLPVEYLGCKTITTAFATAIDKLGTPASESLGAAIDRLPAELFVKTILTEALRLAAAGSEETPNSGD